MSTKHTPGPWEANQWYDEETGVSGWSFSAGGYLLPLSALETDDPEEAEANARLIAAAPELLKALIALHAVARVPMDEDYAAVTNAAEVIARATGASHG
jgi:hypothetical protein